MVTSAQKITKLGFVLLFLITPFALTIRPAASQNAEQVNERELQLIGNKVAASISDGLSPVQEYKVQSGETLWDVAEKLGVTVRELIAANLVRVPNGIYEGMVLRVPSSGDFLNLDLPGLSESSVVEGGQYMVQPGDTIRTIANRYGLSIDQIRLANDIKNDIVYVGQVIVLPSREEFLLPEIGEMRWPFYRRNWFYEVSQGYKPDHAGVDFVLPEGVPIRAVADGFVSYAGWDNIGYGNLVMVFHGKNFYTLYAHLDSIEVEVGQKVDRENILGYSGNTGNSSNPHLHFEIREGFIPLNPCIYLPDGC